MKKSVHFIIIAFLLPVFLTGCKSEMAKNAEALAQEFVGAWSSNDTAAVRNTVARLNNYCDSVQINDIDFVHETFVNNVRDLLADSLQEHMNVLLSAEFLQKGKDDFCLSVAGRIVNNLLTGTYDSDRALKEIRSATDALQMVSDESAKRQFRAAIDHITSRLPVHDQMVVYSRSSSPEKLGRDLRADLNKPGADTALINRQAKELKEIYSESDYSLFWKNFNK